MLVHNDISDACVRAMLHAGLIQFGGNRSLKIYGTLRCRSGRRMHKINRVFFQSEEEAVQAGYRPCGHCLRDKYIRNKRVELSGEVHDF